MRASLLALLLVSGGGCAPALLEPPPVSDLGGAVVPARPTDGTSVDDLLRQAEASFAKRPEPHHVEEARGLFLVAARADESDVRGLIGATQASAWLIEHESNGARRAQLATEAVQAGQWCARRDPALVECTYRLALALGQQARERPSTAHDALPRIMALLEQVTVADPLLDHAGGHRVLALTLLRAPGWPAGPGDTEAGLEHARLADTLVPNHPLNLLVLGEALAKAGHREEAARVYERAEALARAASSDPDASEWAASAAAGRAGLP